MAYRRDPISVPFDSKAAELIRRAYGVKGSWAGDFLSPPGPRARAWAASIGIDLYERDRWGELRYIRAYKRSVFWVLNKYGGVTGLRPQINTGAFSGGWRAPVRGQWETGVRVERPEWQTFRWAVRLRLHPSGRLTSEFGHAQALRLGNNWIGRDKEPNFRQSTPDDREY